MTADRFNCRAVKRLRTIGYTPQLLVKSLTVTYKLMPRKSLTCEKETEQWKMGQMIKEDYRHEA